MPDEFLTVRIEPRTVWLAAPRIAVSFNSDQRAGRLASAVGTSAVWTGNGRQSDVDVGTSRAATRSVLALLLGLLGALLAIE
jgi:hypothetical protein